MRIRTIHRSLLTVLLRISALPVRSSLLRLSHVSCLGQSLCFEAAAQTGGESKSQASGAGDVPPGQTVAPMGDSGYMVPIPEIRMNRIIGDKPAPSSAPMPAKELPSVTPAPAKEPPPARTTGWA